ncbi:hypothetical protein C8N25_11681 [Algoriphagus antarcticus]|uniref:Uncharacterized protein n=1 Tax=Algoriphagus antarcticus TaxID=238540 RepID=A0A3E0DMV1_9BACT|nr:hypothetical protein C8N25_11681 [Algoriphagus antarcticus]
MIKIKQLSVLVYLMFPEMSLALTSKSFSIKGSNPCKSEDSTNIIAHFQSLRQEFLNEIPEPISSTDNIAWLKSFSLCRKKQVHANLLEHSSGLARLY